MEGRIEIICHECETPFWVIPYRAATAKFCTQACMTKHRTSEILHNEKHNRLTILREVEPEIQYAKGKPTKLRRVECLCDCGNIMEARLVMVRNGDTQSCGCVKKEQDALNLYSIKHGKSGTSIYAIWFGMKRRCYDPHEKRFPDYGGRGIKVCDRWLESFENFYKDMGDRPSKKHSLDRFPDNNGNYELSNCRWATKREQANNTRRNIIVEYNGEKLSLSQMCEKYAFPYHTIRRLINIYKLSFQVAVGLKLVNGKYIIPQKQ